MGQIVYLEIRNGYGIKERVIRPSQFNLITGANGSGKTSVLDVIRKWLFNENAREEFVMIGEEEAFIRGTIISDNPDVEGFSKLEVERTVTPDGTGDSVKVRRDGIPVRAPETFLKELFGIDGKKKKEVLAFNPVDLMIRMHGKNMTDKERTALILSTFPMFTLTPEILEGWFGKKIPVNTNNHDLVVLKEAEQYWYDARREANGIVKATTAEVEALRKQLPDNYKVEDWENASTMEISDEIRKGEQTNNNRKLGQEIIDGIEGAKKAINDNYDLQVKEKRDFKDFKVGKVKEDIEKEKQTIRDDIEAIKTSIRNHNTEIERLRALIRDEETAIKDDENKIQLKQKDLDNFDNSILTTKTESLINEMNTAISAINKNRKRELDAADERVKIAEKYLAENPEVDIKPLEEKYAQTEKMKGFVEMAHNLQKVVDRLVGETATAEKYDRFVELCRKKPAELLQTIEIPVKGLSIGEDGAVRISNLPLDNLNTQKLMDVCLDIARFYAKDTPLKLICLDKLEHFDPVMRAEFEIKCRQDKEFQYFVTKVPEEIDADKLKKEHPDLYEQYRASLELEVKTV